MDSDGISNNQRNSTSRKLLIIYSPLTELRQHWHSSWFSWDELGSDIVGKVYDDEGWDGFKRIVARLVNYVPAKKDEIYQKFIIILILCITVLK